MQSIPSAKNAEDQRHKGCGLWLGDFEGHLCKTASLIAQLVKNSPALQENQVQFLGREDPLEKE